MCAAGKNSVTLVWVYSPWRGIYTLCGVINSALANRANEAKEEHFLFSSIIGIAFDCPNANELADFYAQVSGWEKVISNDEFAAIRTPQMLLLVFQTVENYIPPIWPWESGKQQQMAHIDFKIDNLQEAEEHAIKCGAVKAATQYYDTSTVMFDPAGHPFCLSTVQE